MKTISLLITLSVPDGVTATVTDGTPAAASVAPPSDVAAPSHAHDTPPHEEFPPFPGGPQTNRTCKHGDRVEKEGVNKAGKPYHGWFCRQDECRPAWVSAR